MSKRIGLLGKLYIGTAGSAPSTEVTGVGDVELSIKWDTAEVKSRASRAKKKIVALYEASISVEFDDDDADANLTTIVNACRNGTTIAVKVLNKASGRGWYSDCMVSEDTEGQKLAEAVHHKFTIEPTEGDLAPTFV
jgi:hypothetical protein